MEVFFDAGYAKPEWRGDAQTPQPTHEWLVEQNRATQKALCAEAAQYLGECLQFERDGRVLTVKYRFPDFDSEPPSFPEILNGGAYFRVIVDEKNPDGGELKIRARGKKQPDFAIMMPKKEDDEERYLTLKPGEEAVLRQVHGAAEKAEMIHGLPGWAYSLKEGFLHVLPTGKDHVLFVLGIFFLVRKGRPMLWQSLAFTLAHTLTLGLTAAGYLAPRMDWVEAVIALSIAFLAIENLFWKELKRWRLALVFGFGLIHGMGFASALSSVLRVGEGGFLTRLLMANLGVELAQVTILAGAWILTMRWWKNPLYAKFRLGANIVLATVAMWWFFHRV